MLLSPVMDWNNEKILVTGGTGSFGKTFVRHMLKDERLRPKRLVVFSRDEQKQNEMAGELRTDEYECLRYFLGDIRDKSRVARALKGITTIVHAAALKHVPFGEYNPIEFIKTNVIGTENLIEAGIDEGVKRIVALSTDKAAAPINLYGATKLCADKLVVASNHYTGGSLKGLVVRYGNVMGSRGSVIPLFMKQKVDGVLTITDSRMTRFNMLIRDAVKLVIYALENCQGGEIIVPKIPSYRIEDLAMAIGGENTRFEITGIRPGEKLHEEMITQSDAGLTVDLGDYYAILPSPLPSIRICT